MGRIPPGTVSISIKMSKTPLRLMCINKILCRTAGTLPGPCEYKSKNLGRIPPETMFLKIKIGSTLLSTVVCNNIHIVITNHYVIVS